MNSIRSYFDFDNSPQ